LARIACFSVDDLGALADDGATGSIHILYRLPGVANMNSLPWLRRLGSGLVNGRTMDYYADLEKKIDALTPDEVSASFRKFITPEKLVVIRAGDFKGTNGTEK
jgi:hypothetical protein